MRNASCRACGLYANARTVCVDGDGPKDADILVVGQNPGQQEDRRGIPFIGPSGQVLKAQLAKAGLNTLSLRYTNVVRCLTPDNREPTAKEVKACKPYLDAEIARVNPKYIVPLGALATKALAKTKISTAHGQMIERDGRIICPSFHPAATFRDPSKLQVIQQDFARLKRQIDGTLGATQDAFKYRVVTDRDILKEFLEAFEAAEDYAYDTETNGLFLRKPDFVVRSAAFALPDCAWVIPLEMPGGFYEHNWQAQAAVFRVLARKAVGKWACVFHGKYDSGAIRRAYGVSLAYHFDAMLAHYLGDENQDHDLKYVARVELDCPEYDLSKELKLSDNPKWLELMQDPANREKYWEYNARDGWNTLQLAYRFAARLRKNARMRRLFYALAMPSSRALESIEAEGLPVDSQQYTEMETRTAMERDVALIALNESAGQPINWNSPQQIAKVLFEDLDLPVQLKTPTGAPSTSEAAIVDLKGQHPIVNELLHYRELDKILGTYLEGWKQYIVGNRIYFSYKQTGTVCFTADTLLPTQRGVVPFDRIECGDVVLTHRARWRKVLRKVDNGRQRVMTVKLANGVALTTTLNHKYRTPNGWRPAANLKRGDVVVTYGGAERWRPVRDWEETYEVSTWGRVRHVTRGTILKQYPKGRWGHLKVSLIRKRGGRPAGNHKDFAVHRLVAQAFVDNPQGLPEVLHSDGISWNNNIRNLGWGTRADNWNDALKHGNNRKTAHWQCKLTQEQVDAMRARPRTRGDDGIVARSLGVSRELVRDIRTWKRWPDRDLTPPTPVSMFGTSKVVAARLSTAPTFGLVIEEDHSHVTNGVVTHNTGRFSSRLHQIPTDGDIRSIIAIGDDRSEWEFVAADLSQAELRIAAEMSGDTTLIDIYRQGRDVHWNTVLFLVGAGHMDEYTDQALSTAKELLGKRAYSLDQALEALRRAGVEKCTKIWKGWKEARTSAKRVAFGFIYGMYENTFIEKAKVDYDWYCTYKQAHAFRTGFFEVYPGLEPWHNRCKRIARIDGYVTNMFGRVRRLPAIQSTDKLARMEAERQAVNAPVQGTIGDWKAAAMVEIDETIDKDRFRLCGEHHDALLGLVRRGCEDDVLPRVRKIMERPKLLKTFKIRMQVPMLTDIAIGPWGRGATYKDPT